MSIIRANQFQTLGGQSFSSILQVVDTYFTTPTSQSMPGGLNYNDITGVNVSITPRLATSKVMIFARWWGEMENGTSWNSMWSIKRNGTPIGQPAQPGSLRIGMTSSAPSYPVSGDNDSTGDSMSLFYVDSPATTSAITYQLCIMNESTFSLGFISQLHQMSQSRQIS